MIDERFIYLLEKELDEGLEGNEKNEFEKMIGSNSDLMNEYSQQKNIKETLRKMRLKNPSKEIWDGYWTDIYNRFERGAAWVIISLGLLIVIGFGVYYAVESFLADTNTPALLKIGIAAALFGGLMLVVSIIREKIFTNKRDKYKDIQR